MSLVEYVNRKPTSREDIALWVKSFLGFKIHQCVLCTDNDPERNRPHQSQMDYIAGGFFSEFSDCVYIAGRGAGKSYAAAVLDILDCQFKPGIKIAVAAFQRNQSDYIYEYCCQFLDNVKKVAGVVLAKVTSDEIKFKNGSVIKFFSGGKSAAGIKGYHPNVLQVDEADLFSAEQFDGIANALEASEKYQCRFDVLSTNYKINGDSVILKQIERYELFNKEKNEHILPCRIFRTCVIDVLAKCDDRYECESKTTGKKCPLWSACQGRAKNGEGFYQVEGAIKSTMRQSLPMFEAQMLLLRPTNEYAFFGGFSHTANILEEEVSIDPRKESFIIFDFGGKRCPHAALIVQRDIPEKPTDTTTYYVIDEFEGWNEAENLIARIKSKYPTCASFRCFMDPAGNRKDEIRGAVNYKTVLQRAGFYPRDRQLKRKPTFELVKMLIEPASGGTFLKVNKRCKHLIQQIEAAEYVVKGGKPTGEPEDRGKDDLLDCLRYCVGNTLGTAAKHNGRSMVEFLRYDRQAKGFRFIR